MRGRVGGRRVHAVVRPRRVNASSQLWSVTICLSRQHPVCLRDERWRQDEAQALSGTFVNIQIVTTGVVDRQVARVHALRPIQVS